MAASRPPRCAVGGAVGARRPRAAGLAPVGGRVSRFTMPEVSAPRPVRLPPIERSTLSNGVRVWTLPHHALPVVSLAVLIDAGSALDPIDQPGLVGLVADLIDEGAGGRDAIRLAEALGDLGGTLETSAGPDSMSVSLWTLARHLKPALRILADVVARPDLRDEDLTRVRELRLSRLQQLRRSPAAAAERVFARAIFGDHGYGHSALGTTASISAITIGDVRAHYARVVSPSRVTVIAAGDVTHGAVVDAVNEGFGAWDGPMRDRPTSVVQRPTFPNGTGTLDAGRGTRDGRVLFVPRDGAPQSEIRVGHLGVRRLTPDYHALLLLNAGLGGSFSGRLNLRLRQQLGYTYGARSAFDMDRDAGTFACETSVQGDKTADSVIEIRRLIAEIREARPLDGAELELARGTLTRGYARHFETPRQLAGAVAQTAIYGLSDNAFEEFVPKVDAVTTDDLAAAARARLRPDELITVVVGDSTWRADL
ncbi:MAG: insulinase family protein, partial [Acidobacteria bacterium]